MNSNYEAALYLGANKLKIRRKNIQKNVTLYIESHSEECDSI